MDGRMYEVHGNVLRMFFLYICTVGVVCAASV